MMFSAMDGLKRKIEPIEPTNHDVDKMGNKARADVGIEPLPANLAEAIAALKNDEHISNCLGSDFLNIFIPRIESDYQEYLTVTDGGTSETTAWEWKKYFQW